MMHAYGHYFLIGVTRGDYLRFMSARIARIYPLHVLMLFFMVAIEVVRYFHGTTGSVDFVQPFSTAERSPYSIVTNLFLVQSLNIHDVLTWNTPAWSISTECYVYIVFPFLVAAITRTKAASLAMLALTLVVLAFGLTLIRQPSERVGPLDITFAWGYFRCLIEFCLGLIVYKAYSAGLILVSGSDALVVVVTLCLGFVLQNHWHDVLALPLIALLILSVSRNEGAVRSFLTVPALRWLGEASYSIYLVHVPVRDFGLMVLRRASIDIEKISYTPIQAVGVMIVMIGVVIALSLCTWRWFELPARNYLKQAIKHVIPARNA